MSVADTADRSNRCLMRYASCVRTTLDIDAAASIGAAV